MPNVICCVPGCSNHSDCEIDRIYHCLPLRNKSLLLMWIQKIRRSNVPLKRNTGVCSSHFLNSHGRKLRLDELPTQKLPKFTTSRASPKKRKSPTCRRPNKGEQLASLSVSENEAVTNLLTISTTIGAGMQVSSSYMQLVDASTSTDAIAKPMQPNRMRVDSIKDNPEMF